MKTKIFIGFFLLLIFHQAHSYNSLSINNPETWWPQYQAQIENAELILKPMGAFIENQLTLTISGIDTENEPASAQLEIVMDFELPANSMITDSWLWIEGKPKRADILDRWTASAIYEAIVDRRKDPSLLVKNGLNQYRISIYPMQPTASRTFKIVYLTPAQQINEQLAVSVPDHILALSGISPEKLNILFVPTEFAPSIESNNPEITLNTVNHDEYGNCTQIDLPYSHIKDHQLRINSEEKNGLQLTYYPDQAEGYYHISFNPSDLVEVKNKAKKVCFLIDYDKNYTSQSISNLLAEIKGLILQNLNEDDYFNIIFSNISPKIYADSWMKASESNIDEAFALHNLSDYSNLIPTLVKGIEYVNELNEGTIILISNNTVYNNIAGANSIINDIGELNSSNRPIHIIDFARTSYNYTYTNNSYYTNNGYLFTNLARKNNGEYVQLYNQSNGSFSTTRMEEGMELMTNNRIDNIDIYTRSESGICYGRINFSNNISNSYSYAKTIHHFGLYNESLPDQFELTFSMGDELYHFSESISLNDFVESDSVLSTLYNGLEIFSLENQPRNNSVINEIIGRSLDYRILSSYTAFLCLEDSINLCDDCGDDLENGDDWGDVVGVDEPLSGEFNVFPNPFTQSITIEIPDAEKLLEIRITDMSGRIVATLTAQNEQCIYEWNAESTEGNKTGIYIIQVIYQDKVLTKKIIKQ